MPRLLTPLLGVLVCAAVASADNWPAWRGPSGQGLVAEKNLPLTWGVAKKKGGTDTTNIKWKVPLADPGNSTPVIWGDKIFLTQANKGGTVRSLICFAKADGKELWKKDVNYDMQEPNWNPSWYANASPATDGERVVVTYGSAGVYCYDFTGKELWKRTDLGTWHHGFGNGASPVLYGDLVVQWCGVNDKGRNWLLAMNKKTGETVWEHDESFGSWGTPLVTKVNDKDQLLLAQSKDVKGKPDPMTGYLKGFDPKTGKELWSCRGVDSYVYSSPLFGNGVAVCMCGFGGSAIAVKLGGTGDITKDRLWQHPRPANQRVGSGVIVGEHAYVIDDDGSPRCYELTTGKNTWEGAEKLRAGTWGSLIHSDGRLYSLMKNGETVVLAAKPQFEILATNSLGQGEGTYSSPAVADGEIFIRTFKNLYCVSAKK